MLKILFYVSGLILIAYFSNRAFWCCHYRKKAYLDLANWLLAYIGLDKSNHITIFRKQRVLLERFVTIFAKLTAVNQFKIFIRFWVPVSQFYKNEKLFLSDENGYFHVINSRKEG